MTELEIAFEQRRAYLSQRCSDLSALVLALVGHLEAPEPLEADRAVRERNRRALVRRAREMVR